MTLTNQDIERLAKLACLVLTDKEKNKFREQLSSVLDYVAQIERLETADVPPTVNAARLENVIREDKTSVYPEEVREEILKNAPRREDNLFRVPPVFK